MEKEFILNYYEAAQIQMSATYSGDYKKGNKASNKLIKYNNIIKSDFKNYKSIVKELIYSQNPNVIIWIANVALDEKFEVNFVISSLKKIAENKELGIIGFNAKMVLKTRYLL